MSEYTVALLNFVKDKLNFVLLNEESKFILLSFNNIIALF